MSSKQPDWMNEEEERAEQVAVIGQNPNPTAPQLVRMTREPPRRQKTFYLQEVYIDMFEQLALSQKKKVKGNPAPKLAEEALRLLFEQYNVDTKEL